nr:hypothetical protein Iba_chr12aCG16290 [Ipomoea batatas]
MPKGRVMQERAFAMPHRIGDNSKDSCVSIHILKLIHIFDAIQRGQPGSGFAIQGSTNEEGAIFGAEGPPEIQETGTVKLHRPPEIQETGAVKGVALWMIEGRVLCLRRCSTSERWEEDKQSTQTSTRSAPSSFALFMEESISSLVSHSNVV